MAKESFVLVSLKEDKAKKLAQVISNESCRKILDYLAEGHDTTASQLARNLHIPLPTVHYNMKHLMEAKLVESDEYHYSEKGKEVNHYKLANKYIIIAPKSTHGIKEKLKSILPVALLSGVAASTIPFIQKLSQSTTSFKSAPAAFDSAPALQKAALDTAQDEVVAESAQAFTRAAAKTLPQTEPNLAIWFLAGAVFAILLFILVEWIQSKRQ